jgi:tellurite resistance protein TerC
VRKALKEFWGAVRRIAIIVAGSAVLLVGLAMLVLPGPAVIVIPLGVSILASEVPIARRVMRKAKVWIARQRRKHAPAARRLAHRIKNAFARPPKARRRPHSYPPRPSGNP